MAGYDDLDEYEDYYEDEGGQYEEEGSKYGEEEEEEEEEEERLPTQDELEYLELRQRLKDEYRKISKKEHGSGITNSQEKKTKLPYHNFGSFFGPSQPVIAPRVIQESKSLLENPRLAESISKSKNVQIKGGSLTPGVSKPRPNGNQQPGKIDSLAKPKSKIQMLKNTRDYSFLLSDDAELPIPPKNPPKCVPARKPAEEVRSQRHPDNIGRNIINGREERKPVTSSEMRPKAGHQVQRPSTASKLPATSQDFRKQVGRNEGSGPGRPLASQDSRKQVGRNEGSGLSRPLASHDSRKQVGRNEGSGPGRPLASHDSRKQVGRNEGSGPGRPLTSQDSRKQVGRNAGSVLSRPSGQKTVPSKTAVVNRQKGMASLVARGSIPTGHTPHTSRPLPATHKKPLDHNKRDERGPSNGNMIRKPVAMSRPQIKQQPARPPSNGQQKERQQKRPARPFGDEDDDVALQMLRKMTGYNPSKYRDFSDEDDENMEVTFDDIQREEKRSARIARKEDEEEARKIEEEERRERMAAKKRKLNHR